MVFEGTLKLRGLGRHFGDHDEITLPSDRSVWLEMSTTFASRVFADINRTIRIEMDWSELVTAMQRLTKYTNDEFVKLSTSAQKRATAKSVVRIGYRISASGRRIAILGLLRYYLHEVFLIVNIASPGAFQAYEVDFEDDHPTPFRLSAELFEDAWLYSIEHGWPPVGQVSVARVARWYQALLPNICEIADTRLPKALLSLLHASDFSAAEPTAVLWLAQCLESLFDVPAALSRNILQARSFALLGTPLNVKAVMKNIREFFEARNSFVHGGADVSHPAGDWLSDTALDHSMRKWLRPTEFATSLVISALQQHAKNNWRELRWAESFVPVPASVV